MNLDFFVKKLVEKMIITLALGIQRLLKSGL